MDSGSLVLTGQASDLLDNPTVREAYLGKRAELKSDDAGSSAYGE